MLNATSVAAACSLVPWHKLLTLEGLRWCAQLRGAAAETPRRVWGYCLGSVGARPRPGAGAQMPEAAASRSAGAPSDMWHKHVLCGEQQKQ